MKFYCFINCFSFCQDPKDTPPPVKVETREERYERKKREKAEQAAYKLEQGIALCMLSFDFNEFC